jgi:hypothetical protein
MKLDKLPRKKSKPVSVFLTLWRLAVMLFYTDKNQ